MTDRSDPVIKNHYLKLFDREESENVSKSVFISSAISDSENVEELTDGLSEKNISVATEDTVVDASSDWEDDINRAIIDSDVFILYSPKHLSKYQEYQLEMAMESDSEIIIKADDDESLDKRLLNNKKISVLKNNSDIIKLL